MLELYADQSSAEPLFEVEFRPAEEFVHKGTAEQPQLVTLLGRRNRVLIGAPQTVDILGRWPMAAALASDIAAMQDAWDFISVRLACSFVPDRACRFSWARMAAEISLEGGSGSPASPAIAYDLFPRQVEQTTRYKRSFTITPALKFAFVEVSADIASENEIVRYEPQTAGAGLLTSTPTWTFTSSARHGLTGSRELFVLLKKPKGRTARARFTIGAELYTQFGSIPVKRYADDRLAEQSYALIP
jgi:hypothetical protein